MSRGGVSLSRLTAVHRACHPLTLGAGARHAAVVMLRRLSHDPTPLRRGQITGVRGGLPARLLPHINRRRSDINGADCHPVIGRSVNSVNRPPTLRTPAELCPLAPIRHCPPPFSHCHRLLLRFLTIITICLRAFLLTPRHCYAVHFFLCRR